MDVAMDTVQFPYPWLLNFDSDQWSTFLIVFNQRSEFISNGTKVVF